jgi:hypothetical protein
MKMTHALALPCLLVTACGVPFTESRTPARGFYMSAQDRNATENPLESAKAAWLRVPSAYRERFGEPRTHAGTEAFLPADTVVHVEVTQKPSSCEPGDAGLTQDIWVLVSAPRGLPGFVSVGPAWFGAFLRMASVGGTLEIPEPAHCERGVQAAFEGIPRRIFAQSGETLPLRTGRAISARVLEACPAASSLETYSATAYQLPLFVPGRQVPFQVTRERTTVRISARCAGRQVDFAYGPVSEPSALDPSHDPRPQVTSNAGVGQ